MLGQLYSASRGEKNARLGIFLRFYFITFVGDTHLVDRQATVLHIVTAAQFRYSLGMSDVPNHQPESQYSPPAEVYPFGAIDVDAMDEDEHEGDGQEEHSDSGSGLEASWVPTEAEKDFFKRQREPSAKSPLESYLAETPDLGEYFNSFAVPIQQLDQIKMCRAYASYLATMQPRRDRKPYKKSKN